MIKMRKLFMIVLLLYVALLGCEIVQGHLYISNSADENSNHNLDKKQAYVCFYAVYSIILCFIFLLSTFYIYRINRFLQTMTNFHIFLTTYRQTPRSRFIRKYKPNNDVIYEEQSMFERSVFSS